MRSLSIRSVLRSLIAASLVVASAPVCKSSFGVSSGTPAGKCFVSEIGNDTPEWRSQGTVCQLGSHGECENDANQFYDAMEECLRAERERFEREQLFESVRNFVSEFSPNQIVSGLHASTAWIGSTLHSVRTHQQRALNGFATIAIRIGELESTAASNDSRDHLANIYVFAFESQTAQDNASPTIVMNTQQTGMDPICPEWQGPEVATLGIDRSALSNHESCFAESGIAVATPARPPRLDSDLAERVETGSNSIGDSSGIGHCAYLPAETIDPTIQPIENELQSQIASEDNATQEEVVGSTAQLGNAGQPRNMIESWLEPNWDIHRWTIQSAPIVSGPWRPYRVGNNIFESNWFCMESRAPRLYSNLPIDPMLETSPRVEPIVQELAVEDLQVAGNAIRGQLEQWTPWFQTLQLSMTESVERAYTNWRPLYQATRQQSAKMLSYQMKQWGLFFLDSASKIDSNMAIEMAGREYSQR